MKHPIDLSERARAYRFDSSGEEWQAYRRGYLDALDDLDDEAGRLGRLAPPIILDGQEALDV
jgi:hypothetical protein